MEQSYTVVFGHRQIGNVSVTRRGLYYSFHCRCALPREDIFRLMVRSGKACESLGVLVPADGGFRLDTSVPVKQIGEGELSFFVVPRRETVSGSFVPILDEEPFAYISRLKQSFLIRKEGQIGIEIRKMQECI